jgi:hypothetical protein
LAVHNLDVEDEVRVGWDTWLGGSTISRSGWATNVSLLTDSEVGDSIFPALNNSHFTNDECNWLTSWNR